ncbi:sigma 54-interacting transcriptional regulator, partial [bacterium]|nr:sigma 54-interacting transcriptional regulator [bacterium]
MSPGEDLVREALARLGCEGKGDALRETDELLEADPGRASALVDALLPALARAENGAGAAFLAAGAAFLALGDANRARELLQEGLAQLSPGEGGAAARGTLRLARAELALGNTREARAAVARSIGGVLALREDRLLAELGAVLEAAGDTAASTLLAHFRRERHEPGRETARLEVVGRMVRALNSSLLGTAEPLHAILRAVIEETGAQRGFLMLYADDGSPEGHPGNETLRFELGLSRDGRVLGASDFHYSTTIAAASLEEGRCVAIPDLWEARLPLAAASSAQEMGLRSALCAPLRAGRKRSGAGPDPAALAQVRGIAGVLYVDSPTAASFGEKDAPFFEALADGAALAVRAARTASALRTLMEEAERQRAKRPLVPRSTPEVALQHPYEEIVTRDPVMRSLLELLDRVVVSDANVVVRGESGTGKELVARALHRYGRRAKGPFVAIDCGAVPEGLVSSELFGHEAHAFTGAGPARAGLIERAHGGILFLDEVGEMSAAMQGALLRALQEGEVRRLGAERSRAFDVRIVAATHRDLRGMVERGELRHD